MISDLKFVNLPSLGICPSDDFFNMVMVVCAHIFVHTLTVIHDMNSCSESAL